MVPVIDNEPYSLCDLKLQAEAVPGEWNPDRDPSCGGYGEGHSRERCVKKAQKLEKKSARKGQ